VATQKQQQAKTRRTGGRWEVESALKHKPPRKRQSYPRRENPSFENGRRRRRSRGKANATETAAHEGAHRRPRQAGRSITPHMPKQTRIATSWKHATCQSPVALTLFCRVGLLRGAASAAWESAADSPPAAGDADPGFLSPGYPAAPPSVKGAAVCGEDDVACECVRRRGFLWTFAAVIRLWQKRPTPVESIEWPNLQHKNTRRRGGGREGGKRKTQDPIRPH